MADSDSGSKSRGSWTEEANEWLLNKVFGEEQINRWNAEGAAKFREFMADEYTSSDEDPDAATATAEEPQQAETVTATVAEPAEAAAPDSTTTETASDSNSDGNETPIQHGAVSTADDVQRTPPEVVPIPGGQIRIYRDEDGNPVVAHRDGVEQSDGETHVDYGQETAVGGRAISDMLSRFSPQPSGESGDGGDTPADAGSPADPTSDSDNSGDAARDPSVSWGTSGMLGVPIGYKEGEGVITSPNADKPTGNPIYDGFRDFVKEKFQPGVQGYTDHIDEITGEGDNQPPDAGSGAPSSSSGAPGSANTNDPMDPNPINAINRRAATDVFDRYRPGGAGSGGTADSGTGGNGSGGTSGDMPSGLGGTGDSVFDHIPHTMPGGSDSGGNGGGSGSGSGSTEGAAGAAGGTSGGDSTGGAGGGASASAGSDSSGSSTDGEDSDGVSGTVTIDYDGVVVEDEDSSSDGGEEPGVSTSVDPFGDNYQPTPEDLERAVAYREWMRGNTTPIDPVRGGYQEDFRGDGTLPDTPGVDQPGPDGQSSPPPDLPDEIPYGGNTDGNVDPAPDAVLGQQTGPYQDDPLSDPTLGGGTVADPTAQPETEDLEPQVAITAEVNIAGPEPQPGQMYMAIDPNDYAYQQATNGDGGEDDSVTNKLAWIAAESDAQYDLKPVAGAESLHGLVDDGDDDDDGLD